MEAQTSFVGADGAVELHAVADVHLYLALVVDPGHAEGGDALGLHDALHYLGFLKLRVLVVHVLDALQDFAHSLQEFQLAWMLAFQVLHDFLNFHSFQVLKLIRMGFIVVRKDSTFSVKHQIILLFFCRFLA